MKPKLGGFLCLSHLSWKIPRVGFPLVSVGGGVYAVCQSERNLSRFHCAGEDEEPFGRFAAGKVTLQK